MKFACDLFLFDLGNVLVKFDHAVIAEKLSRLSRKPIFPIVSQFIRSGLGELFDEGKISSHEFVDRAIKSLSLPITLQEFQTVWNEMFTENPGMEDLLKQIKSRYPVFVISDTNALHFEFVKEHFSILQWVDQFILSYEVGVRKPHPKIFEEALRRSGTTAEKAFFVDDRKEIIEAASKMGFHAFQFKDTVSFRKELYRLGLLS